MHKVRSYFILVVGFFAAPFAPPPAAKSSVNSATLQFENIWLTVRSAIWRPLAIALLQAKIACDRIFGIRMPLALGIDAPANGTIDQQILKSLGALDERMKQLDAIQEAVKKNQADYDQVTKVVEQVKLELDAARKAQLAFKSAEISLRSGNMNRQNLLSDACARHLGAIGLVAIMKTPSPKEEIPIHKRDFALGFIKEMLNIDKGVFMGIEQKAALTTSDIPLPTLYSGEIVELVYQFGQARKLGTVFPLGAGTVKLPKLTTDTAWGLIATSGTVTEVSPALSFTTFTAEKFGGLIRLPQELDEDSIVAMGQFIGRYGARNIAKCEDYQFFMSTGAGSGVNGTGKGLVKYAVDDSCVWNQGGTTSGGKTKQSQATLQDFRDLRSSSTLTGIVLGDSKYYMHPTYEALLCTFNTSTTVQPYKAATPGNPATLDGFPIEWVNIMTPYSVTASASLAHVLFGDVSYQYLATRNGVRFDTSREAAFATDETLIRGLERFTVGAMASKAVAALVNDAS